MSDCIITITRMKSIALFNNKGGVGKTTLLCNIAAYLKKREEKRVLEELYRLTVWKWQYTQEN